MTVYLETERLILRAWEDRDLEPFARMNSDPMVMEYMPRSLKPDDSAKLMRRFKKHIKEHGYGMYAVERKSDGAFVGTVGLNNVALDVSFAPAVEIAWRLDYGCWGNGFATEAAQAVLEYAFDELKLPEVVAFTVFDNAVAVHIIEKLGLKRDKKGDFHYPTLPKDHPLASFILFRLTARQHKVQAAA